MTTIKITEKLKQFLINDLIFSIEQDNEMFTEYHDKIVKEKVNNRQTEIHKYRVRELRNFIQEIDNKLDCLLHLLDD
ncbi:MAG: hypothetical protein HC803_01770 [Saprospiraceae bacterium]|nr:hypothetical protein [Saprospiraceae bacterium]